MVSQLIVFTFAAAASVALLSWLLRRADALPVDYPNERSLHSRPVPRIGGLGLVPAAIIGAVAGDVVANRWPAADSLALVAGAAILFVISMFDDRAGLPVGLRLGVHFLAATVLAFWLGENWMLALTGALAVAWMTNLFNFMDGANGLAGGMAAIGFAAYGLAVPESAGVAVLAFALAGAAAGFLVFNFDPPRIFLGDAGSIPLGFVAGGMGLMGVARGWWPFWFPLLVFSPFVVDATVTLVRRGWRREKVWQAHREHYYQRLVRMGWSHRRLALCEYAAMILAAAVGLFLLRTDVSVQIGGLLLCAAGFATVMLAVDRRWAERKRGIK